MSDQTFNLSAEENRKVIEKVGLIKTRRALEEVCAKTDPQEDYRAVLDRAYELGFVANNDGSVDFPDPVIIGDTAFDYIIDVDNITNPERDDLPVTVGEEERSTTIGGGTDGSDFSVASIDTSRWGSSYYWLSASNVPQNVYHASNTYTSGIYNRYNIRHLFHGNRATRARTSFWFQTELQGNGYWAWTDWRYARSTGSWVRDMHCRRAQFEAL
ncbi:hypothetical protein M3B43_07355 [Nesterenkonia massiliensis]|uniref:Uncharacterized protein n=1 Tax=Nesterenkonia massiliensis TaxID=1232429 RepID=A0ABT2HRH3_9MICC|nr:hypothetical protein [Nesterenkonia massiliensis]MCT1607144.1 hypothetical protein [Nesterenkonia massiliensis]